MHSREDGIGPILGELKILRLINNDLSLTDKVEKAIEENKKWRLKNYKDTQRAMATC